MSRAFVNAGAVLFVSSLAFFVYSFGWRFGGEGDWSLAASGWPALVDVLGFTVFAVHHSVFARTGLKRWIEQRTSRELERPIYVWVASLLFFVLCLCWRPVSGVVWRAAGVTALLLTAGQIAGLILTVVAVRTLDPLALAGLRAPRPPQNPDGGDVIVARGPYGFVRHPIYFAWLLMVWCPPLMNGTRLVFAVASVAYLLVAIAFEERDLVRSFGDQYVRYQHRVRWRILPGIY